jgi:hypothetical protein
MRLSLKIAVVNRRGKPEGLAEDGEGTETKPYRGWT